MIQFKAKDAAGEIINSCLSAFRFPAGEAHIKREERRDLEPTEIAVLYGSADMHDDLFMLAMWNDYLVRENLDLSQTPELRSRRVLVLPYMPGARADRGMPFGLGVYADFIRNLELDQILIFDPHSGMTGDTMHAAASSITYIYPSDLFASPWAPDLSQFDGVIAPDKGAVRRAVGVADLYNLPVHMATKTRDEASGKLSNFSIKGLPETGRFLVVDDICDGGGTFIGLAEASGLDRERLHLYVSHGVFSKMALDNLPKHFARVYTTNSYTPDRDLNYDSIDYPVFVRSNVISLLLEEVK